MRTIIFSLCALLSTQLWAGVDTATDANDVILAGYDTVAYHTQGKAVKGQAEITAVYNDAIYRFSSVQHRDLFVSNPEKYAPAYGGYCALGAAYGKKFPVDGLAFKVLDGTLYVNKNLEIAKTWNQDISGYLKRSDKHWPAIVNQAAEDL